MKITEITRYLRRNQTKAEEILWESLRNRRFHGKKFLRQHPILFTLNEEKRFFVADFYCADHKLVIEIDGKIHERQKDHDAMRDWIMRELGYRVIRFTNEDVINKTDEVIRELKVIIV